MEVDASYKRMSETFREKGLDLKFVEENSTKYLVHSEECTPLDYTALSEPLAEGNVRLCVLPLEEAPDSVAVAADITKDIRSLLPYGTASYPNPPGLLHITVFHFSRPDDPRPVSTSADHAEEINAQPISQRPGPTYSEICSERRMLSQYVGSAPSISELKVHSVVFAASGTLLIVYTDDSTGLERLRMHLRTNAPGAPEKQARIIHTTLLRVLTPLQLPRSVIEAIHTRCEEWTCKLRGTQLCITKVWYIIESLFATIDGDRTVMHFNALQ